MAPPSLGARRVRLGALCAIVFFIVSGGPFGLEPVVANLGGAWAWLLVLVTPLLWSLPIALMVAELVSILPEQGGYYAWVKLGLGEFWGVQEGLWTLAYVAIDLALYPVLFANYLTYFAPALVQSSSGGAALLRWLIALGLVASGVISNWPGAPNVGRQAIIYSALVLGPFAVLTYLAVRHGAWIPALHALGAKARAPAPEAIAVSISTLLWNYSGWDNAGTFAAEVHEGERTYPRALALSLVAVAACYVLPLGSAAAAVPDRALWARDDAWPSIAASLGGPGLGAAVAVAALGSACLLFTAQLLYVSRLVQAMAQDGWLPHWLARGETASLVPRRALLVSGAAAALFALFSFGKLVVLDTLLYSGALALELAALVALRYRRPELPRPFRIPGGNVGLWAVVLAPLALALLSIGTALRAEGSRIQAVAAGTVWLLAALLYRLRRARKAVR